MEKRIALNNLLDERALRVLDIAKDTAASLGYDLYLVGGVVRDILLKKQSVHDLDLAIEGDTQVFADKLKEHIPFKTFTYHPAFNTATFKIDDDLQMDIAMCRTEKYPKHAELPIVEPATIYDDLKRRDFTINAMAVSMTQDNSLIDEFSGEKDLKLGKIRILHKKSFSDDPTRIWRALRYASRLGFEIEPETLKLIHRDKKYLSLLTPERKRYELECIFTEEDPISCLIMARDLGLIMFNQDEVSLLKRIDTPDLLSYLAVISIGMTEAELNGLSNNLGLNGLLHDTLFEIRALMNTPDLATRSEIYDAFSRYSQKALETALILTDRKTLRKMIEQFLFELKDIRPFITGDDLIHAGFDAGPKLGTILKDVFYLQLDGKISNKDEASNAARRLKD